MAFKDKRKLMYNVYKHWTQYSTQYKHRVLSMLSSFHSDNGTKVLSPSPTTMIEDWVIYGGVSFIGWTSWFRVCVHVFKFPHNMAPGYLSSFCQPVSSVPGRRYLHLADRSELDFPRINLATYEGREKRYKMWKMGLFGVIIMGSGGSKIRKRGQGWTP